MAWVNLGVNVAGLCALAATFLYGGRFLRRHLRGEVGEDGKSFLATGVVLLAAAAWFSYDWGRPAAHELWINIKAPARLWPAPPVAVAGPEMPMGDTATGVRSFRGDLELYASAVTVRRDDNDVMVSVLRFEVLKRSATADAVEAGAVRARLYRRDLRNYTGRRGSGVAVDLRATGESPPVPVTLRLSNIEPYRTTERVEFRIRGAAQLCQPECGVGFSLAYGGGAEASTTAIRVMQR